MGKLRRALLHALPLAAAVAMMGAPPAAAVEVTDEPGGNHCEPVTLTGHTVSGGCEIHYIGFDLKLEGPFGIVFDTCDMELRGNIDEGGGGYVRLALFSGPSCDSTMCLESGGPTPWPVQISGTTGAYQIEVSACIYVAITGGGTTNCMLTAPLVVQFHTTKVIDAIPGVGCAGESKSFYGELSAEQDSHPVLEVN